MRPGVPADLQSAVLRVSGFIIRNTPILYIVRIENPDAQSNRITNPIEQRTDLCRYSPQKFKSKIKSDTVSFGQEVETICRIYKNKANEAGQALCQIIGNRDRHAAKRVFQRSSDYATFRLSRHHGMVRSTAMIHIRRLRQEGKPQNIGIPSQPIYVPAPGFYGKSRDYQPVK